jgi:hypothetical protein
MIRQAVALLLLLCVALTEGVAEPCRYLDRSGRAHLVEAITDVPAAYRESVECLGAERSRGLDPQGVKLTGATGKVSVRTGVGEFTLRWSRAVQDCFGRSPERSLVEAAAATNRALKSASFSEVAKYSQQHWNVVFTDRATALREFPLAITVGGHPGFMLPPSSIYLISDFIAPHCSRKAVADSTLVQVLLHEIGHVIEYLLLGEGKLEGDRQRAEGFATWFEQYSSDFSSDIRKGSIWDEHRVLAARQLQQPAAPFSGSASDYAVASLPFRAIVAKRGVQGLMRVYETMRARGISFREAVKEGLGWTQSTLDREVRQQVF